MEDQAGKEGSHQLGSRPQVLHSLRDSHSIGTDSQSVPVPCSGWG